MTKKRIGIYSGTFDPVHSGHIAFALQALKEDKLDLVVFMPERRPRYKPTVEHFGHRTAMITRAIKPYAKLALLELPDVNFDVTKTLPKLYKEFEGAELAILMGSDVVPGLKNWPDIDKLSAQCEFIIGLRENQSPETITKELRNLLPSSKATIIKSLAPHVSSGRIRHALRKGVSASGLLSSVHRYARRQWLYVSVSED